MSASIIKLPNDLIAAIERALASVPAQRWVRAAQELSERYRGPRPANRQPLATGADQALGYAALIMPATYAQLHGALDQDDIAFEDLHLLHIVHADAVGF